MSRLEWMNSSAFGETSSAYTWSPRRKTSSGQRSGSDSSIESASVWRASSPRPRSSSSLGRVNGGWCGSATRQEPKIRSIRPFGSTVRMMLGGNSESGRGHRLSPSSETSYS